MHSDGTNSRSYWIRHTCEKSNKQAIMFSKCDLICKKKSYRFLTRVQITYSTMIIDKLRPQKLLILNFMNNNTIIVSVCYMSCIQRYAWCEGISSASLNSRSVETMEGCDIFFIVFGGIEYNGVVCVTGYGKISHFVTCEINRTEHFAMLP